MDTMLAKSIDHDPAFGVSDGTTLLVLWHGNQVISIPPCYSVEGVNTNVQKATELSQQ